jgi:hypothetical protein
MLKLKSKKVNPGKSNKMLWAVVAGVSLLFVAFALLLFFRRQPADARGRIEAAISYLKRTEGVRAVDIQASPWRVLVVYHSSSRSDFERIAHYAALRLAPKVDRCTLLLAKNNADQVVFRIEIEGGAVRSEERLGR